MKNLITGYITTFIGLAIMVMAVLYFFNLVDLPEAEFVPKSGEIAIAFLVGFVFWRFPPTKVEEWFNEIIKALINKLKGGGPGAAAAIVLILLIPLSCTMPPPASTSRSQDYYNSYDLSK